MTDGAGFGPVAGGAPVPTPAATGVPGRHELEEQVLGEVTPTRKEEESLQADAKDLLRLADARLAQLEVPGRATLQGSAAKGTWLRGGGDLDVFLLLQPDVPEARLDAIAGEVGQGLLEGAHRKYAQHPYLVGSFRGRAVDLVPAYDVGSAAERRSAVDRTPLHTRWVREHLDARLAGDVRLAKRWLKGIGAYGADTATAGFSGYLVEVLLVWSGSFAAFLRYLAGGSRPRRLALGEDRLRDDTPAALRVVDPVDPERNCAAAVSEATLQLAAQAAAQYLQRPDRRYYFPRPPRAESWPDLQAALAAQGAAWLALPLRASHPRLDLVFPQFQKAARTLAAGLEEAGFPVRRLDARADGDGPDVLLQWVVDARELPSTRTHRGPRDVPGVHAQRFREKWQRHPDAVGPVRTAPDGHLEVEVRVPARTPEAAARRMLPALPLGAHVAAAAKAAALASSTEALPGKWQPAAADFILDRRPWER